MTMKTLAILLTLFCLPTCVLAVQDDIAVKKVVAKLDAAKQKYQAAIEKEKKALLKEMEVEEGAAEEAEELSKLDPDILIGEKEEQAEKTMPHNHTR